MIVILLKNMMVMLGGSSQDPEVNVHGPSPATQLRPLFNLRVMTTFGV